MKLIKQINEALELKQLQSGWMKSPRSVDAAKAVANGEEGVRLNNGKTYRAVKKSIPGASLKKGMILLGRYNQYNQGVDIFKLLRVQEEVQGEDEVVKTFNSVREALLHHNVKTLKQLEEVLDEKKLDLNLFVEDMEDVEKPQYKKGAWYYLFEGRFCRGSGAERVSFALMEEYQEEEAEVAE